MLASMSQVGAVARFLNENPRAQETLAEILQNSRADEAAFLAKVSFPPELEEYEEEEHRLIVALITQNPYAAGGGTLGVTIDALGTAQTFDDEEHGINCGYFYQWELSSERDTRGRVIVKFPYIFVPMVLPVFQGLASARVHGEWRRLSSRANGSGSVEAMERRKMVLARDQVSLSPADFKRFTKKAEEFGFIQITYEQISAGWVIRLESLESDISDAFEELSRLGEMEQDSSESRLAKLEFESNRTRLDQTVSEFRHFLSTPTGQEMPAEFKAQASDAFSKVSALGNVNLATLGAKSNQTEVLRRAYGSLDKQLESLKRAYPVLGRVKAEGDGRLVISTGDGTVTLFEDGSVQVDGRLTSIGASKKPEKKSRARVSF